MKVGELIAKRLPVVLGILLVAAVGWATWQALRQTRQTKPVYNGKPLSCWLSWFATDYSLPESHSLFQDTNAVPFLIKALKRDSWFGAAIYRKQVWPKLPQPIQKHLPRPADNHSIRTHAADLLAGMGLVAKPSIPSLIRALKEDDDSVVRLYAAMALGYIGIRDSNVVTALIGALNDKDAMVRQFATTALDQLDPKAAAKAGIKPPPL
jgi:hypothetical protein